MVGLDKAAVGCLPGRRSAARGLDALDDKAAQPIGTETEPVADREAGLSKRPMRQSHLPLLTDDRLPGPSELALALGRTGYAAG
jgi:hypothetical protein